MIDPTMLLPADDILLATSWPQTCPNVGASLLLRNDGTFLAITPTFPHGMYICNINECN
jgi:hypothetical protein